MPRLAIVLLILVLAGTVLAAAAPAYQDADSGGEIERRPRGLLELDDAEAARLAPLPRDLRAVLVAEREALDALRVELAGETDLVRALDIQRRIQVVKQETECDLLRVQARHARAAGRVAAAERLEAVAERLASRARHEARPSDGSPR